MQAYDATAPPKDVPNTKTFFRSIGASVNAYLIIIYSYSITQPIYTLKSLFIPFSDGIPVLDPYPR